MEIWCECFGKSRESIKKLIHTKSRTSLTGSAAGRSTTATRPAKKPCRCTAYRAVYGDDGTVHHIHNRKLDALEDLIEAANGKPVLVAYWFRHDLERIKERLHQLRVPFSQFDSSESIARWTHGELPAALIHPASAGHGLNLQAGGRGKPPKRWCVSHPELQTLLELRYLFFMTWEEISVSLRLETRWVHRLHNRALNEVEAVRYSRS